MAYSIEYIYKIIDQYSPQLKKMTGAMNKYDKQITQIQSKLGSFQQRLNKTGKQLANVRTVVASLGTQRFLAGAMEEALEFNKAMNMTRAVISGITENQMSKLKEKALEWGAATQFSSIQVSEAMAEFGKKGLNANQILEVMEGNMSLAAAGELTLAEAASFTMGIINQFGMELSDAQGMADTLALAASNSATSVKNIASAMNNTGLQAKVAGLSVQDTTIALMMLAQQNLEGSRAGTYMMNALKSLQVMAPRTQKGFEALGINIDQFRDSTTGQITNFFGLITAMKESGASGAQLAKMFPTQALKAMQVLVETDTAELEKFQGIMGDTTGASKEMADKLLSGPVGTMVRFESVTQNLRVAMGEVVAQALTPLMEKLNSVLGSLQKNNPLILKMVTYFLMAIVAIGAIAVPLGMFLSVMSSLTGIIKLVIGLTKIWSAVQLVFNAIMAVNPVVWVVLGIMALIAAIVLAIIHWDKVVVAIKKVWTWLSNLMKNPLIAIPALIFAPFISIPLMIIKQWQPIQDFFMGLGETIANIKMPTPGEIFQGAVDGIGGIFGPKTEKIEKKTNAPVKVQTEHNLSVYTEKDIKVSQYEKRGNLGYNYVGMGG